MASYAGDKTSTSSADEGVPKLGKVPASNDAYALDEKRRAALAEIDEAPFSWFHVKVCMVAGVGFFTDAYDIFAINIASTMLGYVYGKGQKLSANQDLGVKVATPVGTLCGQLLFGWLADVVGRKRMYGVELMLIIIATFGQTVSGQAHAANIIGVLCAWRFIMGIGIGGDYPLSAVISSEFATTRTRGRLMTAVFANQGWGQFTAALVAFIIVSAYKGSILHEDPIENAKIDQMWRILIGLGCVPGAIALYFRLTIPETPRFTMDVERNVKQASQDVEQFLTTGSYYVDPDAVVERVQAPKASRRDFVAYFSKWENLKLLIGTSYSWFALDIAFYGLGLNSSVILNAIGFGSPSPTLKGGEKIYTNLKNITIGNMVLSAAGLIPGYWATFLVIDKWGRKPIQLMGFTMLTILFIIMGFGYDKLIATKSGKDAFIFLYCLTNFFQNFGPNTTTFIVPGEAFPTRYRSTAHGISAASGKLGAIVAQVGFGKMVNIGGTSKFVNHLLEIFAFWMLTGIFSTLLIKETKLQTLEELSNENQEGFIEGGPATNSSRV
ncbi:phosphate transporter [Dichomitus squalens]|uniref:Phosphate transporter n=1 Tax=Dichomitus squalens TaxID=114155 RepID=A0A4Q9ME46_9APHY|nr:phosphate transporter [Dichomitus squalens LYAD-421 SS1]EJF64691.1 phosphate transporter [Dichomitus squalens LYAD-421 SS1]TBU24011.1 phosphate transporter [Dichomitus squalens]TBU46813.1 phosphate transporter [Dichomitus squalens]TBU63026.1 phosphate transporter [Dichomitus squalens]